MSKYLYVFFLPFLVSLFLGQSLYSQHTISRESLQLLDTRYSGNYIFYNCEIDLQVRSFETYYQIQLYAFDMVRGNELIQNYTVWKEELLDTNSDQFILRNKLTVEGVSTLFNAVFTYDKEKEGELRSMEFTDYQIPTNLASKRRVVCKSLL